MRIGAYRLAQVEHPAFSRRGLASPPYTHQAELYDQWANRRAFLVATPTGSGKTRAAAFPILEHGESAVFIYPTNALIEDQEHSIRTLLDELRVPYYRLSPGSDWDPAGYQRARAVVARVDAQTLEEFRRERHRRAKGSVLAEILGHQDKPLLLLTNPDTLFQMLALRYRSGFEILNRLLALRTLVVDEFHLYGGVELADILFVTFTLLNLPNTAFERVVFLSATPPDDVVALLEQLFAPLVISSTPASEVSPLARTVLHRIDLEPCLATDSASTVSAIAEQVLSLRPELERLQAPGGFIPLVVILNSVFAAITLEDMLVQRGMTRRDLGIYRGLSNRAIREIDGKLLVIGTSAIEVGVDFHARYLMFEANSGRSFLQRLGRIGRHEEALAWLYAPLHVVQASKQLTGELARADLEQLAHQWYGETDARPWFAATRTGLLSATALVDRQREIAGDPAVAESLREAYEELLQSYSDRLGAAQEWSRARRDWLRGRAWLKAYSRAQTFRSSGMSSVVFDGQEATRRGSKALGQYEADLRVLLEYANILAVREDHVVIKGFGKRQRVQAESLIPDDGYGLLSPTSEVRPYFLTEGGARHPLSDLVQKDEHIVVKVPREAEQYFDWRMDYYPTRGGFLVFDGNALLAFELCDRHGLLH